MTKQAFAELLGVTPAYVSWLMADNAPWLRREVARKIAFATNYNVTPNDPAGLPRRGTPASPKSHHDGAAARGLPERAKRFGPRGGGD
ncbi:hypothetical protein [Mesorhizobium sp. M6A.T.Cr.TU.016.01.1.1]|uniref:hypothetical protein n=1 Tax=Mesorhizobium sp. M6A.T.Cr.TU.016.01.1.1 TaxID=2493677 RepID=UPI000F764D37|nr:hypothetical protein [Mesorhizobium sp. M6A.T.Cr.TU.016.01.1.1]AZO68417.1 hypothetical protein EJ075_28220 [Mesorhizobium sp. M6A.T.Cr.TU.016.01.1.1]